jgi:hypothetical protein
VHVLTIILAADIIINLPYFTAMSASADDYNSNNNPLGDSEFPHRPKKKFLNNNLYISFHCIYTPTRSLRIHTPPRNHVIVHNINIVFYIDTDIPLQYAVKSNPNANHPNQPGYL